MDYNMHLSCRRDIQHLTIKLMMTSSNGRFFLFPRQWPFTRGIPQSPVNSPHKAPVMRTLMFRWCGSAYAVKQTVEWPVIWDYMTFMWCHRNGYICLPSMLEVSLRWRHNGCDSVSNHQPHHCLLNRLFRRRSKKTSKLRVTGLCAGNSPVPGEFPAQMASYAENGSIWWRHHDFRRTRSICIYT